MIGAAEIAERLADRAETVCRHYLSAGERKGNYWIVGNVQGDPGRSMFVRLETTGDKKAGRWTDAATGRHGNLLDVISESCGLSNFGDVLDEARKFLAMPTFAEEAAEERRRRERRVIIADHRENGDFALRIWREAGDLVPSIAADYLERRLGGRHVPDEVLAGGALRFHPACPFGAKTRHPCLVALYTDATTGEPRGAHRTALTAAGEKIDRMALGPIAGCVIRLWPDEAVEQGLVVGEGIETVLAASFVEHSGTTLRPAWAAGFAGNMRNLPVLSGIDALTLLVDHDSSETGQSAAAHCSTRWTSAGREVIRLTPKMFGDFNDVLRAAA